MKKVANVSQKVERAADALRLYEMKGRITLPWGRISASQRKRWIEKALVVIDAAEAPDVTPSSGCIFCDLALAPVRGFHAGPAGEAIECPLS